MIVPIFAHFYSGLHSVLHKTNNTMIFRTKESQKYHAPDSKVTDMALESSFCQTGRFTFQVDQLEHLYHHEDGTADEEQLYFEF